jgi:hypothetical protein
MPHHNRASQSASRRREAQLDILADDAREELAARFIDQIENLLATEDHRWAELTLRGIQATVEHTRRVTVGQRIAVAKIVTSPKPAIPRRWEERRGRWY